MNKKIRVLCRAEVINAILDISYNAEHRIDICGNSRLPSLIISFEENRKAIMNAKKMENIQDKDISLKLHQKIFSIARI
jgi:hypothetical protein